MRSKIYSVTRKKLPNYRDERIGDYGRLVDTQRRLHRLFERSLRTRAGMSISWYEALLRLAWAPSGHLSNNEIAEAMTLSSGGATRLVDSLEEVGYVERVACPTDRRVSWIRLTEKGNEALTTATSIHLADVEDHFTSKLDDHESAALADLLRRLRPRS